MFLWLYYQSVGFSQNLPSLAHLNLQNHFSSKIIEKKLQEKKQEKTQENPYFTLNYQENLWVFLGFFLVFFFFSKIENPQKVHRTP